MSLNERGTSQTSVAPDQEHPDTVTTALSPGGLIVRSSKVSLRHGDGPYHRAHTTQVIRNRAEQKYPRTGDIKDTSGNSCLSNPGCRCQYWRRRHGPAQQVFCMA